MCFPLILYKQCLLIIFYVRDCLVANIASLRIEIRLFWALFYLKFFSTRSNLEFKIGVDWGK